jgi:SsrA-binding protein
MKADKNSSVKLIQKNRKAFSKYEIIDKLEAGLVLKGSEVKSLRAGHCSIQEAYARIKRDEVWLINMEIAHYAQAGPFNHEPKRTRKLLLNRSEINRLSSKMRERGHALIPLSLYFKDGYAKVELGLGKGKTLYDKRESIKKRDSDRDLRKRSLRR